MDQPILFGATPGARWPANTGGNACLEELAALLERSWLDQPLWLGYVSPAECLRRWAANLPEEENPDPAAADTILKAWSTAARLFLALQRRHSPRCRLLHLERLQRPQLTQLAVEAGQADADWISGSSVEPAATLAIDPCLEPLLWNHPELPDLYADLEGCADLLGRSPELSPMVMGRANPAFASACLHSWHQRRQEQRRHAQDLGQLATRATQLEQERLQLHELLSLTQRQAQEALTQLQTSNGRVARMKEELREVEEELVAARERCDACLEQLEQTQVDLELTFQDRQAQHQLNEAQAAAIGEASLLLRRLSALRGVGTEGPSASIQVLALLEGYRHSLKRAERLLGSDGTLR